MPTAAYSNFASDPNRLDRWLFDITPRDSTGAQTTVRIGTRPFITSPSDSPANTRYLGNVLQGGFDFSSAAHVLGTFGFLPPRDEGQIVALNDPEGSLDAWLAYSWPGAKVVIRHGGESRYGVLGYSEYKILRVAEVDQLLPGPDRMTLKLRSQEARLRHPVERRVLGGFGYCLDGEGTTSQVTFGAVAKLSLVNSMTAEWWMMPMATSTGANQRLFGWSVSGPFWAEIDGTTNKLNWSWLKTSVGTVTKTPDFEFLQEKKYRVAVIHSDALVRFLIYDYYADELYTEDFTGTGFNGRDAASGSFFTHATPAGALRYDGMLWDLQIRAIADDRANVEDRQWRPLTDSEKLDANLKLYAHMNQQSGTTVTDASPSPSNGTLSGDMTWRPTLTGDTDSIGTEVLNIFGKVENVTPQKVHESPPIYLCHVAESESLTAIREGGVARTLGTAYTNFRTFDDATTSATRFDTLTCPIGTYYRFNVEPAFPTTFDAEGDATGAGYVETASEIARRVITTRGPRPIDDATEIDDTAFDGLVTDNGAQIGYVVTPGETIEEMCAKVLGTVGAVLYQKRRESATPYFTVARFEGTAASSSATFTERDVKLGALQPLPVELPKYKVTSAFRRNWTPLSTADIQSSIRQTWLGRFLLDEWRFIGSTNSQIQELVDGAQELPIETYFLSWQPAAVEAQRLRNLLDGNAQGFDATFRLTGDSLDLFDVVTFHYRTLSPASGTWEDRFQTSASSKFLVLSVEEDTKEGTQRVHLWREDI